MNAQLAVTLAAVSIALPLHAQMQMSHDHEAPDGRAVPLVAGLGNSAHTIRTSSAEAQRYFNQGLDYIWAFNHDEARRSFERAAQLDPKAAMPEWGIALAVGPNYNDIDIGHVRSQQAVAALAKARELAVTPEEHDYVEALASRYTGTGDAIVVQG
ncbi:MAG TPA: tetratricopeptide repeat protein, partial [Edaphobacter sp.]